MDKENLWEVCEHIYIGSAKQILLKRDKVALCRRCTMELPTEELQAVFPQKSYKLFLKAI